MFFLNRQIVATFVEVNIIKNSFKIKQFDDIKKEIGYCLAFPPLVPYGGGGNRRDLNVCLQNRLLDRLPPPHRKKLHAPDIHAIPSL